MARRNLSYSDVTPARLEALAFAIITGWMPRKAHGDTMMFVSHFLPYEDRPEHRAGGKKPYRMYGSVPVEGAPTVEGTVTMQTYRKLTAAGFRCTGAASRIGGSRERGRGGDGLDYVREGRDDQQYAHHKTSSSYVHLSTLALRFGYGGDVLDGFEIPEDITTWITTKRAEDKARYERERALRQQGRGIGAVLSEE